MIAPRRVYPRSPQRLIATLDLRDVRAAESLLLQRLGLQEDGDLELRRLTG